jgi:hypothetical protein
MHNLEVNRIGNAEILIVGGTIQGVAAALELRRLGRSVVLAIRENSPAAEFGPTMGAWLTDAESTHLTSALNSALHENSDDKANFRNEATSLLDQSRAITAIEDLLLDAGVELFYGLDPVGVIGVDPSTDRVKASGALFGGKFGLAVVTASKLIDATVDGKLARTSGRGTWIDTGRETRYSACFLTDKSNWHDAVQYSDGTSLLRRGPLAEFRFGAPNLEACQTIRRAIIDHQLWWNTHHPDQAFRIERASDAILTAPGTRLQGAGTVGPEITGIDDFYCIGTIADSTDRRNQTETATNPCDSDINTVAYFDDRTRYVPLVPDLAETIVGTTKPEGSIIKGSEADFILLNSANTTQPDVVSADTRVSLSSAEELRTSDPQFDEPDVDRVVIRVGQIRVIRQTDLGIVGGGTSGSIAAYQAAALCLDAVCIEKHSDIGGISTIGGVPSYWYGRRTPYFRRLHRKIVQTVREKHLPVSLALLDMVTESNMEVVLDTPTVGTISKGSTITHIICNTHDGLGAIAAKSWIDATSDGDLAAWAGVPYTYGNERDEITYWCSFGSFQHGTDEARRQYMSVVDPRSALDTTRAIVAGRRMGGLQARAKYLQHYLALRESRHILGRKRVNYLDIMMGRAFPDAVMGCKSNLDIKGMASSGAALAGFIERSFHQNYVATIPYGAIVPKDIGNLLVVGKAYSITHDALSMARMQPDMMTLGAVAAYAVAQFIEKTAPDVGAIELTALQATLFEAGILLPGDLPIGQLDERIPPDEESVAELVERLNHKPMESSEWARLLAAPQTTTAKIGKRGIVVNGIRNQLDRIAATLGNSNANDRLIERLDALLVPDTLPEPDEPMRNHRHDMPDHGFASEPVYLINAISRTGDERLVTRLKRIASLLHIDPKVSDHRFGYIHCVAYAAEHLAAPEAGEVACGIMDRPEISERILRRNVDDPRDAQDYIGERYAYLGLCLARSAARCGIASGYRRLVDYVGEMRLYLARSARSELSEILRVDYGFNRDKWMAEIQGRIGERTLPAIPYRHAHL